MRRYLARWAAAVTAVASAALISGCGDGSGGLPDPHFLLRGATLSGGDVTSAHLDMTASGPIPGLSAQQVTADVVAARGATPGASVGVAQTAGLRIDFVEHAGALYTRQADGRYAVLQQLPGGGSLPLPSAMLDPQHGLAHTLSDLTNVVTEAREDHGGTLSFRVTGDLPDADVASWLPNAHAANRITVWFAAAGRHQPVGTRLTVPRVDAAPSTVDFTVSAPNRKVQVPAVD